MTGHVIFYKHDKIVSDVDMKVPLTIDLHDQVVDMIDDCIMTHSSMYGFPHLDTYDRFGLEEAI